MDVPSLTSRPLVKVAILGLCDNWEIGVSTMGGLDVWNSWLDR